MTRLERLTTFPLMERPLIFICLEKPEPHTRVLWGMHCVIPSFTRAILEKWRSSHLLETPALVIYTRPWRSRKIGYQSKM